MREGLKLADSLFSAGKWRVVGAGGWVGLKDDCFLASLRLDPFCGSAVYVCVSPSELCARYGDFKWIFNISSYTRLISCLNS